MELPDFAALPLGGLVATLLFFAAIDTAAAYLVAVMNSNFTSAYALDFLRTHILKTGSPILFLAIIGNGVAAVGIPPVPGAGLAASAALAIYALTVIASIRNTWIDKATAPTQSTNIAPIVETPPDL